MTELQTSVTGGLSVDSSFIDNIVGTPRRFGTGSYSNSVTPILHLPLSDCSQPVSSLLSEHNSRHAKNAYDKAGAPHRFSSSSSEKGSKDQATVRRKMIRNISTIVGFQSQ